MNNWVIFLAAVAVLLFMLSQVNMYIDLHVCRLRDNDNITVSLYALRPVFVYTIKIPAIEIVQYKSMPWITSKIKSPQGGTKTHIDREQRFVKRIAKIFVDNPRKFKKLMQGVKRYIRFYRCYVNTLVASLYCERLDIRANYGFEDADRTGVMMGVFGAAEGFLLSSIHNRLNMEIRPDIKIVPVYGRDHFEIELKCIFRIRLGKVISTTLAMLINSSRREATRSG